MGVLRRRCSIVGAGPPASPRRVPLAAPGATVVVVDKAAFPRDKCCGDGLTTRRAAPARDARPRPDDGAVVAAGRRRRGALARRAARSRFPLPATGGQFAAVARRLDLDAALVDVARAAGRQGARRPRASTGAVAAPPTASCSTSTGDRRPVARPLRRSPPTACGRRCARRSALAEPGYLGEWHAFRQYFAGVDRPGGATGCACGSSADLLPGYAWSFPLPDGRANVGFGIRRATGSADGAGHEGPVARPARPAATSAPRSGPTPSPRRRTRPGRSRPGIDPTRADRGGAGAVRRRRRRGHRPDDRRGHRPGAADRAAGRRGDRRPPARRRRQRRTRATSDDVARPPGRRPPDVASLLGRVLAHRTGARGARPRRRPRPTGPGATSPAGCSRTTPGPSPSPRRAGAGTCSARPAPSPDRDPPAGRRLR